MVQIGIGPISWVIGAELFEQNARQLAGSVASIVIYVTSFIVLLIFEPLNDLIDQFVFVIFLTFSIGFLVFIIIVVPETKNKTFREITATMSSRRMSFIAPS